MWLEKKEVHTYCGAPLRRRPEQRKLLWKKLFGPHASESHVVFCQAPPVATLSHRGHNTHIQQGKCDPKEIHAVVVPVLRVFCRWVFAFYPVFIGLGPGGSGCRRSHPTTGSFSRRNQFCGQSKPENIELRRKDVFCFVSLLHIRLADISAKLREFVFQTALQIHLSSSFVHTKIEFLESKFDCEEFENSSAIEKLLK